MVVIDGLSRMIGEAKRSGAIEGVQVSRSHSLSHILFVNDVVLFGGSNYCEWAPFS